jgi:hypothetical protein
MLTEIPPLRPRRGARKARRVRATPTPPVAPLALVSATFDDVTTTVALAFDRAVDVSGIDAGQVSVNDAAATGFVWVGASVDAQPTPESVVLGMAAAGSAEGPTVLNATSATGVVAVGDGGTWAGVTDLELPFP